MTDLPPYTHVPGITPHPMSDPRGHMGDADEQRKELSHAGMIAHGMFLFNLGSYWEAHEAWEHLWMALGRSGSEADIVKGLIKLAACGVKCLQANPVGASRHSSVQVLTRAFDIEAGHCPNSEPERSKHVWLPRLEIKTARRDDLWQALPENSYA